MALPQTLEPNEKGVALYVEGVFQGYEEIRVVSPDELLLDTLEVLGNDGIHRIRDNLLDWDNLSSDQKRDSIQDIYICLLHLSRDRFLT